MNIVVEHRQNVMSRLAVHFCKKAPDGVPAIRICLSSNQRPGLDTLNYADPDDKNLENLVAILAGQAAEHQNECYGDHHDPDAVANAAVRCLHKLRGMSEKALQAQMFEEQNPGGV